VRGLFFPLLLQHVLGWLTAYGCTLDDGGMTASTVVPKDVFQGAFPSAFNSDNHFRVGQVNTGFLGVVRAEGIGHGRWLHSYRLTFCLQELDLLSTSVAPAIYPNYVNDLCRPEQANFRAKWGVDGTLPAAACPREFEEVVNQTINDDDTLGAIGKLRVGFKTLSDSNVGLAMRAVRYPLWLEHGEPGEYDPFMLASAFYTTITNHYITAIRNGPGGDERAVCPNLNEDNCLPLYWRLVRNFKGPLKAQMAHLATVDNVKWLLRNELEERRRELADHNGVSPALECRIKKLQLFIDIVESGGVSQHLAEWAAVVCEANSSRWEQVKNGLKPGPPKLLRAASVTNIPLSNARLTEVLNFLAAFGFPTTVTGVRRTTTVLDKNAFEGAEKCNVQMLSKDNWAAVATRCVLAKARHQVKVTHGPDKDFFYRRQVLLVYNYEAPVAQRVAECLGEGIGGVTGIDPGGRAFTEVRMEFKGTDDGGGERFEFKAREYFKELPGKILARTARSAGKLSRAQLSRNERSRDRVAQAYYVKLKAKIDAAEKDGRTTKAELTSMRKQLNKGYKAKVETDVEKMAAEPPGRDGQVEDEERDVQEEMAELDAEFKATLKEHADWMRHKKQQRDHDGKYLKREYHDEFLGPLWTDIVEAKYQAYRQKRQEEELKIPTRRFFLKYKVEKRMRRRAKWINIDTHRMVVAEQDAMLAQMIPEGTSLVICARLNFHNFKALSRRVKKYFSYLALANFHDRMAIRCQNVGAVLLGVSEGYTTKKCPECGTHVNVGRSKEFACDNCDFECGRDLKVRAVRDCGLYFSLNFFDRGRFASCSVYSSS
jgi:phage FluMu protein Com